MHQECMCKLYTRIGSDRGNPRRKECMCKFLLQHLLCVLSSSLFLFPPPLCLPQHPSARLQFCHCNSQLQIGWILNTASPGLLDVLHDERPLVYEVVRILDWFSQIEDALLTKNTASVLELCS